MDDDDFGGFETAETFESGDVSPAIPWAAFSAVPGMTLTQSSPPEILMDNSASSALSLPTEPFPYQADIPDPAPVSVPSTVLSAVQQQVLLQLSLDNPSGSPPALPEEAKKAPVSLEVNLASSTVKESEIQLQQARASLEAKLSAAEEEKVRIKSDLEELMEKHSRLENDFLKEKEDEAESYRVRYTQLQEKHKTELDEIRKAGHEALSIIVEEFKALMKSAVHQQQETSEKHLEAAIQKQAHKCEDLLNAQHQRLLELLDTEREALEEKLKEALSQQAQHQKEALEKCLQEERQKAQEATEAAVKAETAHIQESLLEAVKQERRRMEEAHTEDKASWEAERVMVAQALHEALQEERKISKEAVKSAIEEERQNSEKRIKEAAVKAREELMDYVKEQKRLDQVTRQRNLSSLELFLSCAQQQLTALMEDKPVGVDSEKN
ncbi:coiled-coil domain-containing protein 91-like [Polyodon spathula]|uniref:coiled-coil domain-containing protein 91-like n=1 Tax=Polyodon spathula TaxID=7913 RepID=UPI001B7F4128|nr:coiled-coil domain-containing protein 91-like [Polyodon spathula]XP_041113064.1 coiled-coil domain-containing protein 91-like [Polyodon spathula]